jgi:hypothetical protein
MKDLMKDEHKDKGQFYLLLLYLSGQEHYQYNA